MSNTGSTIKAGIKLFNTLTAEKHHSSVTDWIEILTGDNYAEDELDAVSELVQAVDIQPEGPDEASRAIRKKMKYGSTHRQLRALTLLKSLSENSSTFHKSFITSPMLLDRLKETARDPHTDPRVKRKLLGVMLGWKKQAEDGDRGFTKVAGVYAECGGGGGPVKKPSAQYPTSAASSAAPAKRDEGLWDHSWDVSPAAAAASRAATKEQEQQAKLDAIARKEEQARAKAIADAKDRERAALERRERELVEREQKLKMREAQSRGTGGAAVLRPTVAKAKSKEPKRPPFNFEKEKPQIVLSVATAQQAANNLINAIRLVNREQESITENVRVQKYLEEAKLARRKIIRYIQVVEDEEFIGTLLSSNENIITALQLYDKMAKPATNDSDDEADVTTKASEDDAQAVAASLAALRLQQERESELAKLQAKQRAAVQKDRLRRQASEQNVHSDLAGLSFGPTSGAGSGSAPLPPPIRPASPEEASSHTLSDLSDYDSSDDDYRLRSASRSRQPSMSTAGSSGGAAAGAASYNAYGSLTDNLLDTPGAEDPFADPFFGEGPATPAARERKEWTSV